MRAKSAPEGCSSRVVDARRRPPIVHSPPAPGGSSTATPRPPVPCHRRPPGCRHGSPHHSPAHDRARAPGRHPRPGGRLAAAAPARGGPRLRPARLALRRGSPGRRPARQGGPAGARRAARHGHLRRWARWARGGRRRPRRHPHDLRTRRRDGRGRHTRAGRRPDRHPRARRVALLPAGRACTGAGSRARPTSTRSAWSVPVRCGCCPCGGTSRSTTRSAGPGRRRCWRSRW